MCTKILLLVVMAAYVVMAEAESYPGRVEYGRTSVGDSVERVSLKMLNEIYKEADDKNVIASPLAVMLLLSLYAGGAGEQGRVEISNFLEEEDNYKLVSEVYGNLNKELAEQDPSHLTLANKVYVSDKYTLAEQFKKLAADTYDSEVETINFEDSKAAADKINQWAEEKTQGHITNPIDPDTLNTDAAAALFNVIFFQGQWHVPFEKENTKEKDFYIDENTIVKKPTMSLQIPLFYAVNTDGKFKMVELPYKEEGFRMVVVLPDEIDGLPELLEKLTTASIMNTIVDLAPSDKRINLEIPRFEVKNSLNLKEILPKLGVSKIFTEPATGIVKDASVVVSDAFQDAFIRVDEEGATAGAFTGEIVEPMSRWPKMNDFIVDHPFLYFILHHEKMLFIGTYTH